MEYDLTPFQGWVLENFPFIEDDMEAIDNYQLLCKIVEYMNQISANTNILEEDYNNLILAFQDLRNYVNTYLQGLEEVQEAIEVINSTLDDLTVQVNKNTTDIENNYTTLYNLIGETYNSLKNYIDSQVAILDDKIEHIQIGAINVYDPTTGLISPLQLVLNNLYSVANRDGLTATEFDALNLTATGFDAYQITAYEFDSQGKSILT